MTTSEESEEGRPRGKVELLTWAYDSDGLGTDLETRWTA